MSRVTAPCSSMAEAIALAICSTSPMAVPTTRTASTASAVAARMNPICPTISSVAHPGFRGGEMAWKP
jgi:hypothetical protein